MSSRTYGGGTPHGRDLRQAPRTEVAGLPPVGTYGRQDLRQNIKMVRSNYCHCRPAGFLDPCQIRAGLGHAKGMQGKKAAPCQEQAGLCPTGIKEDAAATQLI